MAVVGETAGVEADGVAVVGETVVVVGAGVEADVVWRLLGKRLW